MSDGIRIFKNPNYDAEAERLVEDPIIVQLAAELPEGLGNEDFSSWAFVSSASREYNDRGGRKAISLGGPAEAVKRVYARRPPAGYRVSEHTTPEEQASLIRSLERGNEIDPDYPYNV